ncbi:hypothetical protein SprV_0301317300 [Sparganum proliferum]
MPSSDTSSGSWSESDTEESMSSTSLVNERSSSLEGSSVSTDEEVGSTPEVGEKDSSSRESLRKWALRLKIPHSHVKELLKALKLWLPDLPADARTLLVAKYVSAPSTAMVSGCLPLSNGRDTVSAFAERIFFTLFSEDVAEFLTFYGRKAGTRGFFESPVYFVILEVFNRWNKDHHSDRQQLENAFKNAFKKGHDRYQRKCQRASTSRQSQDPATTNTDPTMDNGDNQQ